MPSPLDQFTSEARIALRPLIACQIWTPWRAEPTKRGRWTKVPYDPLNPRNKAQSDNSATWGDFDQACAACQQWNFDGIGVMMGEIAAGRHLGAIDVDASLLDGVLADWAAPIVDHAFDTYWEITP